MIVRSLVKAVKTQQLFALTVHLTRDLEAHPLVGHQRAVLQGKGHRSSFNFRSA
jgi:hypothetical protein